MRAPTASPNHQVNQIAPGLAAPVKPPNDRLATPIDALTLVLATPARSTNLKMFRGWSNARGPSANLLTKKAPDKASNVLPSAMPSEAVTELGGVVIFTRNAPRKMTGQKRYPNNRRPASAIPVGGHTAVALA